MNDVPQIYALYLIPIALAYSIYLYRRYRRTRLARRTWEESQEAGLTEPASLHPVLDLDRCIGSGACAKACPEQAMGISSGKGFFVNPSACIGHGACASACPMGAIKLVFGTAKRGMDIPQVSPTFETNVPGVFIAGELGGMGLIRKAVEQGKHAVNSIARRPRADAPYDLVIVGGGPAGLTSALSAVEHGLRYVILEQESSLGGTVLHYPRNKIVMSAPMDLPLVGRVKMSEISKESLLSFWEDIVARSGLNIEFGQTVQSVKRERGVFSVKTNGATYIGGSVVLATGRRGTPRRLDVPGEELPKVVYRLIDPEQYSGRHVLVVGGGDSAVEAAISLAAQVDVNVTLSYRGAAFNRIKSANRRSLDAAVQSNAIELLLGSTVTRIDSDQVTLELSGLRSNSLDLKNDYVVVCAGGILPTDFLREIGILVETHHGQADFEAQP